MTCHTEAAEWDVPEWEFEKWAKPTFPWMLVLYGFSMRGSTAGQRA